MDAVAALAPGSGLITAACTALGLSRASLHRLRLCARGQRQCERLSRKSAKSYSTC